MESVFGKIGPVLVAIAIFFFAFTSILAYYYIAETNIIYLAQKLGLRHNATLVVKISAMLAVGYAPSTVRAISGTSAKSAWA